MPQLRLPYKSGTVRVTSPFGRRILNGVADTHKGIDLVGSSKTIVAPCDGYVAVSNIVTNKNNRTWEWGNYVCIVTSDGYRIYMCHMSERKVKTGDTVKAGDVIGIEGNTGYSFGSHCHFEVRTAAGTSVNPAPFLGIQNSVGTHSVKAEPDYATLVCQKCGFEPQTKAYLDNYKYAKDLWRKLWGAMK